MRYVLQIVLALFLIVPASATAAQKTLTVGTSQSRVYLGANFTNAQDNFTELYHRQINVKEYGAAGNGTDDDTTAIQSAITAAQLVYGKVHIPAGNYLITNTLVISSAVSIEGESLGSVTSAYLPTNPPYLTGSVIVMETAATDAISITTSKMSVNLKNIGIKFASAISFLNTGHGIKTLAANDASGYPGIGIQDSSWENIMVFGTDGNHYAFALTNIYLNTFTHIRSYGGGGIDLFANNNSLGTGNNLFTDSYVLVCLLGTSHGYYLRGTDGHAGQNFLNTFVRMQSNTLTNCSTYDTQGKELSPPSADQKNIYVNQYNDYLHITAPDFESGSIYINPDIVGAFITPGNGFTTGMNTF